MNTGLHTGPVGFTAKLHEEAPPVEDFWDEVVEVSFRPTSETVALVQWGAEAAWPLALEQVDLRVRYCAYGIDQARAEDTVSTGSRAWTATCFSSGPRPQRRSGAETDQRYRWLLA